MSYAYDALGRVTAVTDRNGNTQSFTYDAKGQITKVTDKNGNETVYTYDGNGNIIKTTDALGTEVLFEYNANDQLTKMTQNRVDSVHEQSEQLITLYQYNGRNLVTKVVRSSGDEELYTYDGNGNMLTKTDADGYVTEYSYNSLDLVSHINYNDTKEVSYQYNKVGELVKMDDWLGTTTFEVDLLGQLKKVTDHKGNVVEYTYDAVGNQTSVTYPDETTVTKTYDEVYNLTNVKDAENQNYLYQYDDAGRVTKLTYPNGWVEDYTYDAEGNLLKTVDTDPFHNNRKSTKYEYRYDAEGNLVSEYKRDTTAANRALTTTYTYDALNRLTSAHEEGIGVNTTRTYEYDTLGNMIREEQDGCIEYRYNGYSLDESTKCGTIPNSIGTAYWEYTYDGRGNLISNDKYTRTTSGMDWQNVETYVYDETNRMVQGTNENGEVSIYTYNGLGIRVGRELIVKDNTHGYTDFHSQTPSVETGIDKPEVVKESYVIDYTSATFNTLVMDEEGGFNYRWTYGLERLNVKITSEGTNWWGQHVTTDILKDYLHQDRLGSTTNLTDTFGRVVGRADYNEWGEMTYREALSITSSYRRIYPQSNYTGHDWDDVLSMYYAKARFYSADDKRFVAMDPVKGNITDPLSLVSYLYCVDNPLRYVDPLGLQYEVIAPDGEYVFKDTLADIGDDIGGRYVSLDELFAYYGTDIVNAGDINIKVDYEGRNFYVPGQKIVLKHFEHSSAEVIFEIGRASATTDKVTNPSSVIYSGPLNGGGMGNWVKAVEDLEIRYRVRNNKVYVDMDYFNKLICNVLGADRKVKIEKVGSDNSLYEEQMKIVQSEQRIRNLYNYMIGVESFEPKAYYASTEEKERGILTIGVGYTFPAGKGNPLETTTLTEEEGYKLFLDTKSTYEDPLTKFMLDNGILLTEDQFNALFSTVWTIGPGFFDLESDGTYYWDILDVILEPGVLTNPSDNQLERMKENWWKHTLDGGVRRTGMFNRRRSDFYYFTEGITNLPWGGYVSMDEANEWLTSHGFPKVTE